MDVSTLAVQVKSDGIAEATEKLNQYTSAAIRAEDASEKLSQGTSEVASANTRASSSTASYAEKLMQRADLLGKNMEYTASYMSSVKGLSDTEAQLALSAGRSIDAYKASQAAMVSISKEATTLQASYDKLSKQADSYYSGLEKSQAKGNTLNAAGQYAAGLAKIADANRALTVETNKLAEADAKATIKSNEFKAAGDKLLSSLSDQAGRIGLTGKALRDYNIGLLETQAKQLNVVSSAAPMIASLKSADMAAHGAHSGVSGITRELIVLGHEASQGNWSRFGGSILVLLEQINFVPAAIRLGTSALAALGGSMLALGGFIAVIVAGLASLGIAIYEIYKNSQLLKEFQKDLIMTNNSAGTTAEGLLNMAHAAVSVRGSLSEAKTVIGELAGSGKYTASQIELITKSAVGLSAIGVPLEQTKKDFESLAEGVHAATIKSTHAVSDNAEKLNEKYHYMNSTTWERIRALEDEGKAEEALQLSLDTRADANALAQERIRVELGKTGKSLSDYFKEFRNWVNSIGEADTAVERQAKLVANVARARADVMNTQAVISSKSMLGSGATGLMDPATAKLQIEQRNKILVDAEAALYSSKEDIRLKTKSAEVAAVNAKVNAEEIANDKILSSMLKSTSRQNAAEEEKSKLKIAYDKSSDDYQKKNKIEYERSMAELDKKIAGRVAKPKSEGLTGVNANIKDIEAETSTVRRETENQIKLYDYKYQHNLISEEDYMDFKQKSLDELDEIISKSYDKRLNELDKFTSKDKNTNNAADREYSALLIKQGQLLTDIQLKKDKLALKPEADEGDRLKKEADASDKTLKSLEAQAKLLESKNAAYIALSATVRAEGVTERQMQDDITQQNINRANVEIAGILDVQDVRTRAQEQKLKELQEYVVAEDRVMKAQKEQEVQHEENVRALEKTRVEKAFSTAKLMEDAFKRSFKSIEDAFVNFISTGKLDVKGLVDVIVKEFARVTFAKLLGSGDGGGGLYSLLSGGSSSGGGSSGGLGSLIGQGSSLYNYGTKAADFLGFGGAAAAESTAAIDVGVGAFDLAGTAGGVAGAGGAIGGSSMLAAIGGPVGIAAIAGIAAISLLGGGGETRVGGGYNYVDGQAKLMGGPSGGEIQGPQVRDSIKTTADGISQALKDFGSTATLGFYTAGLESSKNGKSHLFTGGNVNGVGFGQGSGEGQQEVGTKTPQEMLALFTTALKASTIQALTAADLGGYVGKYLSGLGDVTGATEAQVTAILAQVAAMQQFAITLKVLPFYNLKAASGEATLAIANMAGGFASLTTKLNSYYNNFYTASEKANLTLNTVGKTLGDVGIVLPKTREEFRALVDSFSNLNDTTSQIKYTTLLGVADAFASAVPAASAAATAASALSAMYAQQAKNIQSLVTRLEDFSTATKAFQDNLLIGSQTPLNQQNLSASQASQFNSTVAGASQGNASSISALQGVTSSYLTTLQNQSSTALQYAQDFANVNNSLTAATNYADNAASIGEQQLTRLGAVATGIAAVNDSVLTVADLLAGNFGVPLPGAAALNVPGFANGGDFGGGVRLVGEEGPELEATGPSRIYTAAQTSKMLGGGDNSAELAQVKQELAKVNAALVSIAVNTRQSAKISDKWDNEGLPSGRIVTA